MGATTRSSLLAGMGLMLAANGLALGGVWYNRSGTPDATLMLTERELSAPYAFWRARENSGLALHLAWEVDTANDVADHNRGMWFSGEADWLDDRKLDALGINVRSHAPSGARTWSTFSSVPVDVLLVLELNGPAYRRKVERMCRLAADRPTDKAAAVSCESAKTRDTRLFIVDAGLDHDRLRRRYPDASMYAIVHGQIKAAYIAGPSSRTAAYISGLAVQEVDVPAELRSAMSAWALDFGERSQRNAPPFEATVAIGRRLEPWLVSVTARGKSTGQNAGSGAPN